jgi:hypothetical protein
MNSNDKNNEQYNTRTMNRTIQEQCASCEEDVNKYVTFGGSANKVNRYRRSADIKGVALLLVTVNGWVLLDVKNSSLAYRHIYNFSYYLLSFTIKYF